jgi:putative membrane protein
MKAISFTMTIVGAAVLAGCATQRTSMGAGPAVSTTTTTSTAVAAPAPAASRLSVADQQFVAVAAGSGMYEVEAARLAATRAADAQVKAYAQMLVDHHTANNNELIALVSSKGHRLAPGLPPALQQKVATLSGLSGAAFDREFVRTTGVQDHMAAVAAFEQNRSRVNDRDLQAYIDKSLPVLRSHLQQAQDLAGRIAG